MARSWTKSFGENSSTFLRDLFLVATGIRQSCLIDYKAPPTTNISKLLVSFCPLFEAIQNVSVVQLDDFVFLVNRQIFSNAVWNVDFINVGSHLESPRVSNEAESNLLSMRLCSIYHQIKTEMEKQKSSICCALGAGAFIITVAGWLLEYPFVYFDDRVLVDQIQDGNCLNNINLKVFQPLGRLSPEMKIVWNKFSQQELTTEFSVLSCSVPECLFNSASDQFWLQKFSVFNERLSQSPFWSFSRLEIKTVALPHVLL